MCHIPTPTIIRIRMSRLLSNDQAWKTRDHPRWIQQQPQIESSWRDGASPEEHKTTWQQQTATGTSQHRRNILKHLLNLKDLELARMASRMRLQVHRYRPSEVMELRTSRIQARHLGTRQCSQVMMAEIRQMLGWVLIIAPCQETTTCRQQSAWSMSKSEAN